VGNNLPGVTVTLVPASPAAVQTGFTNLIGIVGTATDGPPNTPQYFSDANSMAAVFGTGSLLNSSLVREALSAMPEGANFVGVRVTDGTETAAVIELLDGAGVVVASFVAIRPGSNANAATAILTLQSGTITASPVYRVTLNYSNRSSEQFGGIVGYATAGGPYVAATFIANLLAAINGTTPNSLASQNFVATAGTSTAVPVTGTTFTASGGTDGASGVTSAQLLGVPGDSATRTGMYALGGTGFDFLILAANTDPSVIPDAIAFAESEQTGFIMHAFPLGSSPTQMVANKITNSLSSPWLITCGFWDYVFDTYSGTQLWVSPMGKIAGIMASLDPSDDPINQPTAGAAGINQTEATAGQGLDAGDQSLLFENNIIYLGKFSYTNNLFRLAHGLASDGSFIADSRMQIEVASAVKSFLYNYIGAKQSVPPLNVSDPSADTDKTRTAVRNGLNALGSQYENAGELQDFNAICDKTNNLSSTVLARQLIVNVTGETFPAVYFAMAFVQVGSTVAVSGLLGQAA
jgi:phage tail sheath protein FI